jgi:hypothetical protein
MDIQALVWPARPTADELIREALLWSRPGDIISVKATLAAVRERHRDLLETDCQLAAMIIDCATTWGRFVTFDVREP